MNWFVAKIIFRITGNANNNAQFEEQLRLIVAETRCQAFEKAAAFGRENEARLANRNHENVSWQFVNVAEVNPVDGLKDGTELYCNIHESANPEVYIGWAHHKAALIALNN